MILLLWQPVRLRHSRRVVIACVTDHWRTSARLVDSRLKPGMCLGSRSGYLGTQEDLKNWGWGEPIVLSPIFNKRLLPPSRPSTITGLNSEWTGLVDWHKSNETRSLIFFLHELTWCQLVIFYFFLMAITTAYPVLYFQNLSGHGKLTVKDLREQHTGQLTW